MMSRPAPKHAPRVPFVLLLLGLLVGGLIMLLVLNTASAANELRRHDLAAQDDNIAATVEQLRNEVAASMAPNNLARVASQLGMVPAGNPGGGQTGNLPGLFHPRGLVRDQTGQAQAAPGQGT